MPTANSNSANRRRRRAELLLKNNSLVRTLESALFNTNRAWKNNSRKSTIRTVRLEWPKNLVPLLNATLMNKLRTAYTNIKPKINNKRRATSEKYQAEKRTQENARARRQKQHANFLLTNEGKQWKRKNNERKKLQWNKLVKRGESNTNMWARTGMTMYNI
jgi:hypothetical protein